VTPSPAVTTTGIIEEGTMEIGADGEPDATERLLTVTVADASLTIGVRVTEVTAGVTVSV
jgi:hypothetical protein